MTAKGYIVIEFDDGGNSCKTEVFDKYQVPFSILLAPGVISVEGQQMYIRDNYIDGVNLFYWPTLSYDDILAMVSSGRVDVQNHTLLHLRLNVLPATSTYPPTVDSAYTAFQNQVLQAESWIERNTRVKPIEFTPPYAALLDWEEAIIATWYKYYIKWGYGMNQYATAAQEIPLPKVLNYIVINDAEIVTYGWTNVDAMIAYLQTNAKILVIIMHDITYTNDSTKSRNLRPDYFKTFMSKIDQMRKDGHVLNFTGISKIISTDTDQVLYFPFSEGVRTTTYDGSIYSNIGTLAAGCTWVAGKVGKAVQYNGAADTVSVPNSAGLNITGSAMSIAMWVKLTALTDDPIIIIKGLTTDGYKLQIMVDGSVEFTTRKSSVSYVTKSYAADIATGVWKHITVVKNGTAAKIYIDTVDRTLVAATHQDPGSSTDPLYVGASNVAGILDEVHIYKRAITTAEIAELYTFV